MALFILACQPAADGGAESSSLALTQGAGGAGTKVGQNPQAYTIREFVYPEEQDLEITWVVESLLPNGLYERYEERLHADGTGQTRLDLLSYAPDLVQAMVAPTSQQVMDYENRMRFLVKYRNPHVRSFRAAGMNFQWIEDPNLVQVAGIDCIRTTAKSRHGHGDIEFLSDAQTDMVLGWTKFAPNGSVLMKLETTSVNTVSPNHTGVTWSSAIVGEQHFLPGDAHLLAFEPSVPGYLPTGFFAEENWIRFSAGLFPGMSDMLVNLYSDGVHLIFVAQHNQKIFGTQMQIANKVVDVQQYDLGGIRVAEGTLGKRKYYVASMLSLDEIRTVFGSLLE
ncbi:MAG: hypothetical protein ACPG31_01220 [Planctomycetota bacterium]